VGSTLALAHPLYYDRLVQLASTIFGTIIRVRLDWNQGERERLEFRTFYKEDENDEDMWRNNGP
jgi:hypothetical protein